VRIQWQTEFKRRRLSITSANFEHEFGQPGDDDAKLLEADTNNDLALIALAGVKNDN